MRRDTGMSSVDFYIVRMAVTMTRTDYMFYILGPATRTRETPLSESSVCSRDSEGVGPQSEAGGVRTGSRPAGTTGLDRGATCRRR